MNYAEMIRKLKETDGCLQSLNIRSSRENVMLLANCMVQMDEIIAYLNERAEHAETGTSGEEA